MGVGELLQSFFHALPCPFPSLGHHLGFDLGQRQFLCLMCFHGPFALVQLLFLLSMGQLLTGAMSM